jgi:nucleoside-diphosphate-sugar epimerase
VAIVSDKTVLVLGATGFVGSYLADELRAGHRVVTTSRSGASADHAFELADAASSTLFDTVAPDVVVNCTVGYGPTLEECFEVNVRQSAALYMALRRRSLHFVQLSSVSAAPDNRHATDYGLTKSLGEELLRHCAANGSLRVSILRFGQIFDLAGRFAKSQPGLAAWVAAMHAGAPITVYTRDAQPRSYIPVETVVRAVVHAIRTPVLGTHDVIGPDAYTPLELARLLVELAGYDASRIALVDKHALGYRIPACSPHFERWMSQQEPCATAFARLVRHPENA